MLFVYGLILRGFLRYGGMLPMIYNVGYIGTRKNWEVKHVLKFYRK